MPSRPRDYKPYSKTKVYRLPADGEAPTIISVPTIDIKNIPKDLEHKTWDLHLTHVPDLRPYWSYGFLDRESARIEVGGHGAAIDGVYLFYFITDPEFPRNETIRKMVQQLIDKDEDYEERLFWRGDVFFVGLGDPEWGRNGYANYRDAPKELLQMPNFLTRYFQHSYEEKFLEQNVKTKAELQASPEEHQRKKDLVFARMTFS
ncbi:hypothetical protein BZA05DRAFT_390034 [Tricharina praecox]|uniref:uncharacterized protein n=1 Tax=Tricharina praecox TaxID=43433 RepID=UPI00221EB94F|nr:uncharacterized protein BZA05DRAFT_390034 [Tricharina praecox]KAI5855912.1 hypothetical protein BZA05DRAFT_390034 [Tricharina praecox]